ncbi:hypothetical protein C8J56DRAFT_1109649 [Mycena floridula]|nr:hypothetical protein C8J56DRAFT_1109649 [Mycena floridula]
MSTLISLSNDLILDIVAHNPPSAVSLSQVSRRFFTLAKNPSCWLTVLKASRNGEVPPTCSTNLDLNALAKSEPAALERIARQTCIRECNLSSPNARLIGPVIYVKLAYTFTIIFIIPRSPLVLVRLRGSRFYPETITLLQHEDGQSPLRPRNSVKVLFGYRIRERTLPSCMATGKGQLVLERSGPFF